MSTLLWYTINVAFSIYHGISISISGIQCAAHILGEKFLLFTAHFLLTKQFASDGFFRYLTHNMLSHHNKVSSSFVMKFLWFEPWVILNLEHFRFTALRSFSIIDLFWVLKHFHLKITIFRRLLLKPNKNEFK